MNDAGGVPTGDGGAVPTDDGEAPTGDGGGPTGERTGTTADGEAPITASDRALITGASAGLGRELAREFARHGHDVVLAARRRDRLVDLAEELRAAHDVHAAALAVDLTEPEAPESTLATLRERDLAPDVLVNNAGAGVYGRVGETELADERSQLRLNVEAVLALTHRFLAERRRGAVLNVGSVAGVTPGPYLAGYYASKAYVNSFTQALAAEHRDDGVDVTLLAPGPIDTEFHDRAGMDHGTIGEWLCYDAERVARAGYEGLQSGRTVVIPGLAMRALVALLAVTPAALQRAGGRLVNGGR